MNVKTNAVIVGRILNGKDLLIAPNAFVNFDVPDLQSLLGILVNNSKRKG